MKYFYFSNAHEEESVLYGNPEVKIVQFVILV